METQAFWNNREVDLMDAATHTMTPSETLDYMRRKLTALDSSMMREHGTPGFIDGHRPWQNDPADWNGAMMLIRGELVTPKPVEVVTRYKI